MHWKAFLTYRQVEVSNRVELFCQTLRRSLQTVAAVFKKVDQLGLIRLGMHVSRNELRVNRVFNLADPILGSVEHEKGDLFVRSEAKPRIGRARDQGKEPHTGHDDRWRKR